MKKLNNLGKISIGALVFVTAFVMVGAVYLFVGSADAAVLTSKKDTLSTSSPGANANHTIQFVTPTGVTASQTVILDFDTIGTLDQFDLTGIAEAAGASDFDLAEDTDASPGNCAGTLTDETLDPTATTLLWGVAVNTTTDTVTFTAPSTAGTYIAAGACAIIEIGTNATSEFTGVNQINNPTKVAAAGTADIHDIAVSGTFGDTGSMLVAVIEGVTVSATVSESLSFSLADVTVAACDAVYASDGFGPQLDSADADSNVLTIAYGTLATLNSFYHDCHDLTVSTNAGSGYNVTVEENTNLLSGAATIDDTTCDAGTCRQSIGNSDDWATATGNEGFGISCNDVTGTPCHADFGVGGACAATPCYRQIACRGTDAQCDDDSGTSTGGETATTLLTGVSPVNGAVGRVEYKLTVGATQEAAAYSNTITYIATGTF